MSVENCGNCAFGVLVYGHNSSRIDCHRHAPKLFEVLIGLSGDKEHYGPRTFWPEVSERDFCGEFELKDAD